MGLSHLRICHLEGVYHFCPALAGRPRWFEGNEAEEFPQETPEEMAAAPSLVPHRGEGALGRASPPAAGLLLPASGGDAGLQ